MIEAHHRRGDRDSALALDRDPIRAHPPTQPLNQLRAWRIPQDTAVW